MKRTKYGFTLIELLIVVAIIAILAAIAVPNFLEAQTRAKVARVNSDQRSLATAIESYAVDLNTYPPSAFATLPAFNVPNPGGAMTFKNYALLTTPVAYITAIPSDVFAPKLGTGQSCGWSAGNKDPFLYWSGSTNGTDTPDPSMRRSMWVLESLGPDALQNIGTSSITTPADADLTPITPPYNVDPNNAACMLRGGQDSTAGTGGAWAATTYDPSNGTNSKGDIFKFNSSATLPKFVTGR